ncbi:type III pantothenate kinase [Acidithiobacillus sp. IBUN Pt1247-S3]|uniref:type III pantothenate kinase n=1 Tax=Acidithiobacillus sp. IBUN Pt1247-S3 TaxID=3166642 RepID=UPI0034E56CDA
MILISIGNTRTLLAHTSDGELFTSERFATTRSPAQIRAGLPASWAKWWRSEEIFLAGVVPQAQQAWLKELQDCNLPGWDPSVFHQILPNDYQPPESLGFDRRCCLLGAWKEVHNDAALVIDAGTAITIDTLAAGRFCGGRIMPGLQSQLDCLQRQTALLPQIDLRPTPEARANDTVNGMLAGVWYGTIAAIRQTIVDFQREHPAGRVFLTGGDANLLLAQIAPVTCDPLLLLRGFFLLVSENRFTSKI